MGRAQKILAGVLALAALACTDGRGAAIELAVEVAAAGHAPQVTVPWWWRGDVAPDGPEVCAQAEAGAITAFADAIAPAVVVIDQASIRVGADVVVALEAGQVPAGRREGSTIAPLAARLQPAVAGMRAFWRRCGRAEAPVDLVVALAPDVPSDTLVLALHTAGKAGFDRQFLAVAGGDGRPWRREELAEGGAEFTRDEQKLVLHWYDGWEIDVGGYRRAGTIAALDQLEDAIPGKLGCASVPVRPGPWAATAADLDRTARLGARWFTLRDAASPPPAAASASGQKIVLRAGASIAAFPLVPPRIVDKATVPNWVDDGANGLHPCEGFFVSRAPRSWGEFKLPATTGDEDPWAALPK